MNPYIRRLGIESVKEWQAENAEHTCSQESDGNTAQVLLRVAVGLVLVLRLEFLNSNAVVMPGETTDPTNFPGVPEGGTVAPNVLSETAFISLVETRFACFSAFSSPTVVTLEKHGD